MYAVHFCVGIVVCVCGGRVRIAARECTFFLCVPGDGTMFRRNLLPGGGAAYTRPASGREPLFFISGEGGDPILFREKRSILCFADIVTVEILFPVCYI